MRLNRERKANYVPQHLLSHANAPPQLLEKREMPCLMRSRCWSRRSGAMRTTSAPGAKAAGLERNRRRRRGGPALQGGGTGRNHPATMRSGSHVQWVSGIFVR